jgi:hypothetical protein
MVGFIPVLRRKLRPAKIGYICPIWGGPLRWGTHCVKCVKWIYELLREHQLEALKVSRPQDCKHVCPEYRTRTI